MARWLYVQATEPTVSQFSVDAFKKATGYKQMLFFIIYYLSVSVAVCVERPASIQLEWSDPSSHPKKLSCKSPA